MASVLGNVVILAAVVFTTGDGLKCWECRGERVDVGSTLDKNVAKPVENVAVGRRKRGVEAPNATTAADQGANSVGGIFSGSVQEGCTKEPFSGKDVTTKDCLANQTSCYKETNKGEKIKVTRMCVAWSGEKSCKETTEERNKVTRCYCNGDKCNAAVSLSSFFSLLTILSLATIIV